MNIYVGNLSWSMSDDDLSNLFTQFGSVTSAKILKDKVSGRSKGFGFVEMETDEEANNAIANLNETEIQGRKIIVNQSQPRPAGEGGGGGFKKRSGGFGGGNRGGGSRGGYGGGGNRGGYGGGRESRDY
ncbi:MAG: RNA-binding protein [Chitinophagaceae bacterium]|jgi:RNA recognition motif-containing protein|nr:RNA-binding protein [Chitinophagaceae bacterium]MBP6047140.1 RNA-binding protein [Ferruginibacter sp.]MBK7089650.1 RNA-binding protein [Chitinophagaceae bacterium]MBK7347378.1 RNA-binding protein [Chitinophagaceae bacterium]MBK8775218.1 RNA-binding protein [Chitinophagaceae bacterium]